MKLSEFYTNVLTSLELHVDEGFVYTNNGADKELVAEKGIPIVIPTKEHLNSLVDKETNTIVKIPFNPLEENILTKGESTSAKKVRLGVKLRLTYSIMHIAKLLLTLASDDTKQKKVKYELQKFLASLSEASIGKKIKDEVDATSIKNWEKICLGITKPDGVDIIKIFSTKAGAIGENKYNRVITIHSPLLDLLSADDTDKDTLINGITIRPKDIVVFRLMLKFILSELDENNVLKIGNNDEHRPTFIGMMQIYIITITRLNKLAKLLTYVDSVDSAEAHTNLSVTIDELNELDQYNGIIKEIPGEKDLLVLSKIDEEEDEEEVTLSSLNQRNAADRPSVLDNLIHKKRDRYDVEEDVDDEPSIVDSILGRKPKSKSNSRYSPDRIYDEAPEYHREQDYPRRPKQRLSERIEARYSNESRYGERDRSFSPRGGRSRERETFNHTPERGRYRF